MGSGISAGAGNLVETAAHLSNGVFEKRGAAVTSAKYAKWGILFF